MGSVVYLDTSAVLRAVLEAGLPPDLEKRVAEASVLITSRLAFVESARVVFRLRMLGRVSETDLAAASREIDSIWARCVVWELSREVCDLAAQVAPQKALRSLDALHLATFLRARRQLGEVELVTVDQRLAEAAAH
jgi:predicted nucleic acid-binding protein